MECVFCNESMEVNGDFINEPPFLVCVPCGEGLAEYARSQAWGDETNEEFRDDLLARIRAGKVPLENLLAFAHCGVNYRYCRIEDIDGENYYPRPSQVVAIEPISVTRCRVTLSDEYDGAQFVAKMSSSDLDAYLSKRWPWQSIVPCGWNRAEFVGA